MLRNGLDNTLSVEADNRRLTFNNIDELVLHYKQVDSSRQADDNNNNNNDDDSTEPIYDPLPSIDRSEHSWNGSRRSGSLSSSGRGSIESIHRRKSDGGPLAPAWRPRREKDGTDTDDSYDAKSRKKNQPRGRNSPSTDNESEAGHSGIESSSQKERKSQQQQKQQATRPREPATPTRTASVRQALSTRGSTRCHPVKRHETTRETEGSIKPTNPVARSHTTVGKKKQELGCKYWATRSSVRSFARTAHSFACSALLALFARSAHLLAHLLHTVHFARALCCAHSFARSLTHYRARGKMNI